MDLQKGILLNERAQEAHKTIAAMQEKVRDIERAVDERQGDVSQSGLNGAIFGTLFWTAMDIACCCAVLYYRHTGESKYVLIPGGFTLLVCVIMLYSSVKRKKYYGHFMDFHNTIDGLKGLLINADTMMSRTLPSYSERGKNSWRCTLDYRNEPPIPSVIENVRDELVHLDSINEGGVNDALRTLYYFACITWTVFASWSMRSVAATLFAQAMQNYDITLTADAAEGFVYIMIAAACFASYFAAKFLWAKTDNRVNNLTMFALLAGVAAFWGILILVLVVIGVIYIIVRLVVAIVRTVVYIAGLFIVGAILSGMAGGG